MSGGDGNFLHFTRKREGGRDVLVMSYFFFPWQLIWRWGCCGTKKKKVGKKDGKCASPLSTFAIVIQLSGNKVMWCHVMPTGRLLPHCIMPPWGNFGSLPPSRNVSIFSPFFWMTDPPHLLLTLQLFPLCLRFLTFCPQRGQKKKKGKGFFSPQSFEYAGEKPRWGSQCSLELRWI